MESEHRRELAVGSSLDPASARLVGDVVVVPIDALEHVGESAPVELAGRLAVGPVSALVCRHDSRQSVHEAAVTDWGGGEGEMSDVKKAIYTPLNINPPLCPPAPLAVTTPSCTL